MNSTLKVSYVIKFLALPKDFDVRLLSNLLCCMTECAIPACLILILVDTIPKSNNNKSQNIRLFLSSIRPRSGSTTIPDCIGLGAGQLQSLIVLASERVNYNPWFCWPRSGSTTITDCVGLGAGQLQYLIALANRIWPSRV